MKNLIQRCKKYLKDTLGIEVDLSALKKTKSLPFFLLDQYAFYSLRLLDKDFVVLIANNEEESTPAKIRKHFDVVNDKIGTTAVFLCSALTTFNRKRLIEYKVPFIVPENQMYLPDLAIDLREHFIQARSTPTLLSPVTQAVVIYAITRGLSEPITPKALTEKLGYTKMSMSRAIDEIEESGLAEVKIRGKNRLVHFNLDRQKLWEKSKPFLQSPVKKMVWLKSNKKTSSFHEAGLTALAGYSMLSPPKIPVYAIGMGYWKELLGNIEKSKFEDEAECCLEIWRYAPGLITKADDRKVDPFSLFLSLKDENDERVQSALDEMMGAIEW